MNHHYDDIRSRIAEPPKWWDEQAVPRYCDFGPRETANIYANEAVLARIECQSCGTPFDVCFTQDSYDLQGMKTDLASLIRSGELHYGDPPNVWCCDVGATMNSVPRRVLQYWRRSSVPPWDWERAASLEIPIEPEWAPT